MRPNISGTVRCYLIDKAYWDSNKSKILAETGLTKFVDGEHYLEQLNGILDDKYYTVNTRSIDGLNPCLKVDLSGKPVVRTSSWKTKNILQLPCRIMATSRFFVF